MPGGAAAGAGSGRWPADNAPFDLAGPQLRVKITRGTRTLPVAEVPNLAVGRQVAIKADLPDTQAARYVMVVAFLRGATNPPPEDWFFRCETWTRKCAAGLHRHRSGRSPAGAGVPGAEHQRRLQHAAGCRTRPSGRLRARLAGSEPGESGSFTAARAICWRCAP